MSAVRRYRSSASAYGHDDLAAGLMSTIVARRDPDRHRPLPIGEAAHAKRQRKRPRRSRLHEGGAELRGELRRGQRHLRHRNP